MTAGRLLLIATLLVSVIALESRDLTITLSMTPGHDIADRIIALIDGDRDGTLSESEMGAYADTVVSDLSLVIDGKGIPMTIDSVGMPSVPALKDGTEAMVIRLSAPIPRKPGRHEVEYRNGHLSEIAKRLVNTKVPPPSMSIDSQDRSPDQSFYRLQINVAP